MLPTRGNHGCNYHSVLSGVAPECLSPRGETRKSGFRRLRALVSLTLVMLVTSLLAGCAQTDIVQFQRTEAPEVASTFGDVGIYVEVEPVRGDSGRVAISIPDGKLTWYSAGSLRLARWLPERDRFSVVENSRFDEETGKITAQVSEGGTYGVFGVSRLPHVRSLQNRLCGIQYGTLGDLGVGGRRGKPETCKYILCRRPYDAKRWSKNISEQSGMRVGREEVQGRFRNLCERCLGGNGGPVAGPECNGDGVGIGDGGDIGDGVGDGVYTPPTLEKISADIKWGGRAVAIAVDPSDDSNLIVASATGGLFKSTDGGDQWTHVSDSTTFGYTEVQYLPTNTNVVLASAQGDTKVSSGGGIYRSTDGGDSWSQISISPPTAACADDFAAYDLDYESEQDRLYAGTKCGIAYSGDGGKTWQFLPNTSNYNQPTIHDVIAPASGDLKVLSGDRVLVTDNGGTSWMTSSTGLPGSRRGSGVALNQIAISPEDHTHIYATFEFGGGVGLWRSTDNGTTWNKIYERDTNNRPPFVRIAASLSGTSNKYDVYFGDGGGWFGRATATHGSPPSLSSWNQLSVDHSDATEIAFKNDGKTPLLLASDGGLHGTNDQGRNWTATGAGDDGYNALQITEITGQRHGNDSGSDLYFATQDNWIWGSPTSGNTWPNNRCCEGFYLNVPHKPLPNRDTRLTGVSCAGCTDYMADPVLKNQRDFPFRPEHADESVGYLAAGSGLLRDASGTVIGEVGTRTFSQANRSSWQRVSLRRSYSDPVALAQIMTYNGPDPSHTRVQNVSSTSFAVKVEEWGYLGNGAHNSETIGYIVLEKGRHSLPGGGSVEVGTATTDHNWKSPSFSTQFNRRPAVVSHTQTFNGPDPVVTRHKAVGLGSFSVRLQEEAGKNGSHATETIGWVAIRSMSGLEGRRAGSLVDQKWMTQSFASTFTSPPVVVAAMQSYNGKQTSAPRMRNRTSSSFEIMVENELSISAGAPKLLKPSYYLAHAGAENQTVFHLSDNNGSTWQARYRFSEDVKGRPKVSGPDSDPTVFTAVRKPGSTPSGTEKLGIKRVIGVLGSGTPLVSDVKGFGSLGTFPTMFAWYRPYGVDPDDPNAMIVPDIIDEKVKQTTNGGGSWSVDGALTDWVTGNGRFQFRWKQWGSTLSQVSVIRYDPTCDDHIMVGTQQAGLFQSFDDGASWEKITGSAAIPYVSSFYFNGNEEAIVSSYGRGLWRVRYECDGKSMASGSRVQVVPDPIYYWKGTKVPLKDIDPGSCPRCRWLIVEEGDIRRYSIDKEGQLQVLHISGDSVQSFSPEREPVEVPVEVVRTEQGPTFEDEQLVALIEKGNRVQGMYLEGSKVRGLVVADEGQKIGPEQLPQDEPLGPRISLNIPSTSGVSLEEIESIVVTGYGFESDAPIRITLDGEPVEYVDEPQFDEQGKFRAEIRPQLDIGGHVLRVQQETSQGIVEDVYSFHVTVSDEPQDCCEPE